MVLRDVLDILLFCHGVDRKGEYKNQLFERVYAWYLQTVKAQIPNRERGSGGDRNSLGVEANGQGSSNR